MNEIKRYDQALAEQLEHLPMPSEDMAWAEMKKLLDEDDDDPAVIPFFRRPGCLLLGLVAALLLSIGGWLYFRRDAAPVPVSEQLQEDKRKERTNTGNNNPLNRNDLDKISNTILSTTTGENSQNADTTAKADPGSLNITGEEINPGNKIKTTTPGSASINISAPGMDENKNKGRVAKRRTAASSDALTKTRARVIAATTGTDNDSADLTNNIAANKNEYSSAGKVKINIAPGTTDSSGEKTTTPDSNTIVKKDSLPPKKVIPPVPSEKEKEEKEKSWMLAAGLSVFHPLAVDGEPAVPYNRYGRKGGVADYIPAAYFRLYRTKKWFAHIEFRYGAPQSVKPFDYKQEIVDSNQQQLRSVFQLNKTYYHQVPISFNYYVLPGLSVGAGVIYNHFVGAVSRQEVYVVATQDTLLSSTVVRDTEAGKYIKNHFQWSAEAQYQWRRLTLGARYSRDINPYIKYTDVLTGAALEKKAKAFNIFLRYELWRSKKWGGNR